MKIDYKSIFDNVFDAVVVINKENHTVYHNKAAEKLLGYSAEEIRTLNVRDFSLEEDKETAAVYFEKLLKDGYFSDYQGRIVTKSGEIKYVQVTATGIFRDGELIGSTDILRDVTEQKLAEFEIEKLAKYTAHNPNPILRANYDGIIDYTNDSGDEILKHWKTKLGKYLPVDIRNFLKRGVEQGSAEPLEVPFKGKIYLLEFVFIREDKLIYIYGRDITETRKAENALRESESKVRAVIDTALDAVVTVDKNLKITEWNHRAEVIFGRTKGEVLGKQFLELIIPEKHQQTYSERLKKYLKGREGLIARSEISAINRRGEIFPIELTMSSVKINGMDFYSAFIRDITERKELEQRKEKLLQDLEHANNELKDFAYVVSHDLKAPLRGIGSLADWICEDHYDQLGEEGREQLTLLKGRVNRMNSLIDGILAYSGIGRAKSEPEKIDLNLAVQQTIDLLSPGEKATCVIKNRLPTIYADRTRIRQLFQNLIGNAIKYMDKPNGLVEISSNENNSHWEFMIRDNGPGIDSKYFDKIFELFQTLEPRDSVESTGIGLTIVKKIINLLGGSIRVESVLEKGTTFYFTLPKLPAAAD